VVIVVANEWLAIDVHLKMPMGHFGVIATAFVAGKVGLAAGERPFQVLVFDSQLNELAGAFVREIVDVLGEGILVGDPAHVIFEDHPAKLGGKLFDMFLADALGLEKPVPAWLARIKARQEIAAKATCASLERFTECLVLSRSFLAV
jgi:hypothetical protein